MGWCACYHQNQRHNDPHRQQVPAAVHGERLLCCKNSRLFSPPKFQIKELLSEPGFLIHLVDHFVDLALEGHFTLGDYAFTTPNRVKLGNTTILEF